MDLNRRPARLGALAVALIGCMTAGDPDAASGRGAAEAITPSAPADGRRPVYVIGHNPNTMDDVRQALAAGANALEPDVQWHPSTHQLVMQDDPVLSFQSPMLLTQWLHEVAEIARSNDKLALIIFDSKLTGAEHGALLLREARAAFAGTNVRFLFNVAHLSMTTFFDEIKTQLGPGEGLMVDETEDPDAVAAWFRANGVVNGAYGDGIQDKSGVEVAIDHAVALKVQTGWPKWVYFWNLRPDGMRDALRSGVDGIDPKDIADCRALVDILNEPELASSLRLATRDDDPFRRAAGTTVAIDTMDRSGAATDANVTIDFVGSLQSARTTITGNKPKRFAQGQRNEITFYGDFGVPLEVRLRRDGTGNLKGWLPDAVTAHRTGDAAAYAAGFGDWIAADQASARALGTDTYTLRVYTGDVDGAGTDADLVLTLGGAQGVTEQRRVNANGAPFERGASDVVWVPGPNIGLPQSLTVYNDGTGDRPDWYVDRVEVEHGGEPARVFDFHRWVQAGGAETVRLETHAQLRADAATFEPGAPITVTYADAPGSPEDRVAIVRDGGTPFEAFAYAATGATSGAARLAAPSLEGSFRLRLYSGGALLAESAPFVVARRAAPSPRIGATAAKYGIGDSISVQYASLPANGNVWVTLAVDGSYATDRLAAVIASPAGGEATFVAPPPGRYRVRALTGSAGTDLVAQSDVVVVDAGAGATRVSANGAAFTYGDSVVATVQGTPGNAKDWVAVARAGGTPSEVFAWAYTNGKDGPITLGLPRLPETYRLRVYENDTFRVLAESAPFTAGYPAASAPRVSVQGAWFAAGSPIVVDFDGMPVNNRAYVAIAPEGSDRTASRDWKYIPADAASGRVTLTVPAEAGTYRLRGFYNNGLDVTAESAPFLVQ